MTTEFALTLAYRRVLDRVSRRPTAEREAVYAF